MVHYKAQLLFKKILDCNVWMMVLLFVLATTNVEAQKTVRERMQLFDADWRFLLGDDFGWKERDLNDSGWRMLDLPHDWSIEGKMNANNPMGNDGGYFPAGIGWYRKTFMVPATWNGKCLSIYFEGAYMDAEVFINGKSLGTHPYGYTSFSYDLTPFAQYGKKNVIAVRINNAMQKNCRWYSGSGIYRHVWLSVTGNVHIANWGVFITTPKVNKETATVQLKTVIKNETSLSQRVRVFVRLLDNAKKDVGNNEVKTVLAPNSEKEITQYVTVKNPKLWDIDNPNLYTAKVEIKRAEKDVDEVDRSFGIRTVQYTPERGFDLNGQTVKLNGGCVHHDNGCLGAVAYDRAEERKVELLKMAGFNAVRTSHNPPSEAFLDACDRLGLLVIDEAFDGWRTAKNKYDYSMYFDAWSQKDIESMVLRDRNHPSVILWSIGNEIIERKEPQAVETAKILVKAVKRFDTTRAVTSAMTTWDQDWSVFDPLMAAHDVAGYNYQLHRAVSDHERVPSRVIVQTESYPRDAFANWKIVQKNNYVMGDFVWTAMDYLGESGIGRYYYSGEPEGEHWERNLFPWHGAYCGDIDITGWRKPISHYRSLLYTNKEMLYMAVKEPNPENGPIKETMWSVWPTWESWTWPGYEGRNVQVEVYSRYPQVKLYLNDQLVGEKITSELQQFKAVFDVPYAPGKLRAIGLVDGKAMENTSLETAGNIAAIRLTADRSKIWSDGQDLSFVAVELADVNGVLQPNADNQLSFTIIGPGTIVGVANADMKDTASYASNSRKAWKGRALVVIKSTRKPGIITLITKSSGLPDAKIKLNSYAK